MELIAFAISFLYFQMSTLAGNQSDVKPAQMKQLTLSQLLFVPWGDAPGQLPLHTEDAFAMGLAAQGPRLQVPAEVWQRYDDQAGLHLLDPASGKCVRYGDRDRAFAGEGELGRGIVDFQVQLGGYILIRGGAATTLEYLNMQGEALWSRPLSAESWPNAVFSWRQQVVVFFGGSPCKIQWYNLLDGSLLATKDLLVSGSECWRIDADHLGMVVYDETKRTRAWGVVSLADGSLETRPFPRELYGALVTVFAGDGHGGCYLRLTESLGGEYSWGHLNGAGEWICRAQFWEVLAEHDNSLVLATQSSGRLEFTVFSHGKKVIAHPTITQDESMHFTGLTADGKIQIDIGNAYTGWSRRLLIADDGSQESVPAPTEEVIARMQSTSTWIGSAEGATILVGSDEGLHVIAVRER